MKIKTKKLSKIKLVIVLRLVKCSCTFPESGMLHVKRPLSPCTSSSTPTDTSSKEVQSDMKFHSYFRILRYSHFSYDVITSLRTN